MIAKQNRQGELRGLLLEIQASSQAISHLRQTIIEILEGEKVKDTPSTGNQMGLALCLHHLYTAIEEIFLRVNKAYDRVPLSSESWHKELLRNMVMEVENLRPRVISKKLQMEIGEYRAFRHVVRHAYDYELDWLKLKKLLTNVFTMVDHFTQELKVFTDFVNQTLIKLDEMEKD